MNGRTEFQNLHNYPQSEVCQWVDLMRTRSGQEVVRLRKTWHTDSPSIQGIWTPMTNRQTDWNVRDLPEQQLSDFKFPEKSATDILLERAEELRRLGGESADMSDSSKAD